MYESRIVNQISDALSGERTPREPTDRDRSAAILNPGNHDPSIIEIRILEF
jgi:hypothetical protein